MINEIKIIDLDGSEKSFTKSDEFTRYVSHAIIKNTKVRSVLFGRSPMLTAENLRDFYEGF